MKTHGKKESFDDWLDDELKSHGDNVSLQKWGHHELDSHYERYGAEDEEIELQGNDGPSYAWDDVYYNCPMCDERLTVFMNDTAICEFGNHSDIVYSRNMLESLNEYNWFHDIGAHENRRNDYKDPEESDGIPVCGICDFSQSYSPDNMVEKDDGSWKCQSCGEITESFNADAFELGVGKPGYTPSVYDPKSRGWMWRYKCPENDVIYKRTKLPSRKGGMRKTFDS